MSSQQDIENELLAVADGFGPDHSLRTAPILTGDAISVAGIGTLPQRALYGRVIEGLPGEPVSPKLYINLNVPFNGVICGVQNSGKSHSTNVLLESCLIQDPRLGALPAPLSCILFHFDTPAGGGSIQPCEAAYIACLDPTRGKNATPPPVTVLVLPTALQTMRRVYAGLPQVRVEPLHFVPDDISGQRLLAMMNVDTDPRTPLYMECIMAILRSMDSFDYVRFREALDAQKFDSTQKAMLNLRLALLDACLEGGDVHNRVSNHFHEGQLTIIDLSSPCMDSSSACGIFNIILGLFVEADLPAGKLIVLDDAHKYLTDNGSSAGLTDSLLAVIRQQRHLATRIVISAQEPTVVPGTFLDLCTFVIAHRFHSPRWFKHLAKHIPAGEKMGEEWFAKIVSLRPGEAVLFAPAGLGAAAMKGKGKERADGKEVELRPFGRGYLLVRSRLRITRDGGPSRLSISHPAEASRIARANGNEQRSSFARATDATSSSIHEISPQANTLPPSASSSKPAPVNTRFTHDEAFNAFGTEDEQSSSETVVAETEESTAAESGDDTETDAGPAFQRARSLPVYGFEDAEDASSESASGDDVTPSSPNVHRRGGSLPTYAEVLASPVDRTSNHATSPRHTLSASPLRRTASVDTVATDDYMSVAEEPGWLEHMPDLDTMDDSAAPSSLDTAYPIPTMFASETYDAGLPLSPLQRQPALSLPSPTPDPPVPDVSQDKLSQSWGNPQLRFQGLLEFVVQRHADGIARVSLSDVVHFLDGLKRCPYMGQKLTEYLGEAAELGLLCRGGGPQDMWLEATEFGPIINVLRFQRHSGRPRVMRSQVVAPIKKFFPSVLEKYAWTQYVNAAVEAGSLAT